MGKTALFVTVHDLLHLQGEITGQVGPSSLRPDHARARCPFLFDRLHPVSGDGLEPAGGHTVRTGVRDPIRWMTLVRPTPEHPAPVHGPFILHVGNTVAQEPDLAARGVH